MSATRRRSKVVDLYVPRRMLGTVRTRDIARGLVTRHHIGPMAVARIWRVPYRLITPGVISQRPLIHKGRKY